MGWVGFVVVFWRRRDVSEESREENKGTYTAQSRKQATEPTASRTGANERSSMLTFPLLNRRLLPLSLTLCVFNGNVLSLVGLDNRSDIRRLEDSDRCKSITRQPFSRRLRREGREAYIQGKEYNQSTHGRLPVLPTLASRYSSPAEAPRVQGWYRGGSPWRGLCSNRRGPACERQLT
jgi:hypothetical protein